MIPYDEAFVPYGEVSRWRRRFAVSLALNLLLLILCALLVFRGR